MCFGGSPEVALLGLTAAVFLIVRGTCALVPAVAAAHAGSRAPTGRPALAAGRFSDGGPVDRGGATTPCSVDGPFPDGG